MNCLSTQNFCSELHQPLLNSNFWHGHKGPFPFNKNSSLKFQKFHVPNGTVHSGCTDQTQATTHLVIVLVSRMPKSGTGDNQRKLSNGKGHLVWLIKISGLAIVVIPVGLNQNGSFDLISNWNFQNFGLNGKQPRSWQCPQTRSNTRVWTLSCPRSVTKRALQHGLSLKIIF